jgi:hypothetical protein
MSINISPMSVHPRSQLFDFQEDVFSFNFSQVYDVSGEPGSSVSIVSGYGRSRFDSRQRRKDFSSSLCVQTGSVVHPASCTMGTGGPLPGAKARPGRDAVHSPPSSAEVENE